MSWTVVQADTLERIQKHAENACLGGVSRVREGADRIGNLSVDQLVGQLGQFSLARWFGDEEAYFIQREQQDLNPRLGDGGFDYKSLPVDVKTSLMRYSKIPRNYRLPVRPSERHEGWAYVAGFVEDIEAPVTVHLSGWAADTDLPAVDSTGVFRGAHTIPVRSLNPMPTLKRHLNVEF